jgi:peptidoglycan-associated lipoprotein
MKGLNGLIIVMLVCSLFIFMHCTPEAARLEDDYDADWLEEETPPRPKESDDLDMVRQQPQAAGTTEEVKLEFRDIQFDYDKYDLTYEAREILARHATQLQENTDIKILIEGHCDERGTIEYNLALGEKRANAVKQYLINYGIALRRLSTISYGKERPADPRHNEAAWAKNRRAAFIIMK